MDTQQQEYWSNFYKKFNIKEPSNFSHFILKYFENIKINNILDIGCGNGRDSYYLSTKYNVVGIDESINNVDRIKCKFIKGDMTTHDKSNYDMIYSRFSLHSITDEQQLNLITSIKQPNTYLCIETRSDKNKDIVYSHGNTHYRNLTNINYITQLLETNNFKILFINESNNFAIHKNENPICIRVICKKNN